MSSPALAETFRPSIIISNLPEIKKYYAIYRRTKNSRIKKKQLKKIKVALYGDML